MGVKLTPKTHQLHLLKGKQNQGGHRPTQCTLQQCPPRAGKGCALAVAAESRPSPPKPVSARGVTILHDSLTFTDPTGHWAQWLFPPQPPSKEILSSKKWPQLTGHKTRTTGLYARRAVPQTQTRSPGCDFLPLAHTAALGPGCSGEATQSLMVPGKLRRLSPCC